MSHPMLRYPDGPAGVALLLLRLSAAAASIDAFDLVAGGRTWPAIFGACGLALMLTAGLATRAAAILLVLLLIGGLTATAADSFLPHLASGFAAAALAGLGPGAYSLDATRFGRRVIRIEGRPPDRGGSK